MKAHDDNAEISAALARFEGFLRKRGFKVTRARLRIAHQALTTPGHFSAIQLWDSLGEEGASVATVYRTLELLSEAGLVRRCVMGRAGGAVYESYMGQRKHHGHLVCRNCGRVIEFKTEGLEAELRRIAEAHGFSLEEAVIQGIGLCGECRSNF